MLTVLCKILSKDKNEKKTQYLARLFKREVLNSATGKIETVDFCCTRKFLIDLLTLTQAGVRKECGPQYASSDYRPDNIYYDKDKDELCIGKQYQPGEVMEFAGDTGKLLSGDKLMVIVGYHKGISDECLGYLITDYVDGEYITSRITESELLERIGVHGESCCNALVASTDDGVRYLEKKAQGFSYTIDTSDITVLGKVGDIDAETLALTEKTVKIKAKSKLGDMMHNTGSNILTWIAEDKANVCNKEQKDFLAEYYLWYAKRTFEMLQGSTSVKLRASKIISLDTLHISKDVEWKYIGYYHSPVRSFKCSDPACGKLLSKAHVFSCDDPVQGNIKLMFGGDCAEQFFAMSGDTLNCLADATDVMETEIRGTFNLFRNELVEKTWEELGMFNDNIISLRNENKLADVYGEDNAKWLIGFQEAGIPYPDSLISIILLSIERHSTNMKDDERSKRENAQRSVSLVRSKSLNTVQIGGSDEEFVRISYDYWYKREPMYTDLVIAFPELKEYLDFVLRYKMYSRPLTGESLEKFNKKHKTTLRRIKQYIGATKFNASELAAVIELAKLEHEICKNFDGWLIKNRVDKKDISGMVQSFRYSISDFLKEIYKKDDMNLLATFPGPSVYFSSMFKNCYPAGNVGTGLKEGVLRRRILLSYKNSLMATSDPRSLSTCIYHSFLYPNKYETDYDGQKGASATLVMDTLTGLKKHLDECKKFDEEVIRPTILTGIQDRLKQLAEEEERKKQEQLLAAMGYKQETNQYQPITGYESFSDDLDLQELKEEEDLEFKLVVNGANICVRYDYRTILNLVCTHERVYDKVTRCSYRAYTGILSLSLFYAQQDSDSTERQLYIYSCTDRITDYDLLPHYVITKEKLGNKHLKFSVVDTVSEKVLIIFTIDGNKGEMDVTNIVEGKQSVLESFHYVIQSGKYRKWKANNLNKDPFRGISELSADEKAELGSKSWAIMNADLEEYMFALVEKEFEGVHVSYYALTDKDMTYFRDIRGKVRSKGDFLVSVTEQGIDWFKEYACPVYDFTEDTIINEFLPDYEGTYESTRKEVTDLLRLLKDLEEYKGVSNKKNTQLAQEALAKYKSFNQMPSTYKYAVAQVVCDKVSTYKLKRQYDFTSIDDKYLNFTTYFEDDKSLQTEVEKYLEAEKMGQIELEDITLNILRTIDKMKKCSDKQRKTLIRCKEVYAEFTGKTEAAKNNQEYYPSGQHMEYEAKE